jgi:AcrR family transcriptional regulator
MPTRSRPRPAAKEPAAVRRVGRRHEPPEARREQILLAALSCFADKGYHATTMDDLVRASGLSKGSLYWHFGSKEEVFLALFDAFAENLYREWDEAVESGDPPLDLLRAECDAVIETLGTNRLFLMAWSEFLNHPAARARMAEIYTTSREKLGRVIARGRESGGLAAGPPADHVAGTLVAVLEGLLLQWLVDPDFPLQSHFDASWSVLLGGLRP